MERAFNSVRSGAQQQEIDRMIGLPVAPVKESAIGKAATLFDLPFALILVKGHDHNVILRGSHYTQRACC